MKKLVYFLVLLFCLSCERNYRCELKYEVVYPDTTWVNTYVFDGTSDVYFSNKRTEYNGKKSLIIHPTGANFPSITICTVPNKESEINVLDFKMYRYGVDVEKKK